VAAEVNSSMVQGKINEVIQNCQNSRYPWACRAVSTTVINNYKRKKKLQED